jgi:tripartite-type tricarboxylate transporter receptor subunit TctC
MMFPNTGAVMAHVKAGRLRALASGSARPSSLAPGLPTIAESGLPGYEAVSAYGMVGPAKMPPMLTRRLNEASVQVLQSTDVKEKLFGAGIEVIASSPEGLLAQMKTDTVTLGKVIKAAKIRIDE